MDLDDVADELYGLDPAEFVAARATRAARVREEGDRALASAIGTLRKPTTAAWLVNILTRTLPDEIEALLQLGGALRDAQSRLSGTELRRLTAQRQRVVSALARRAGGFAADRGRQVGKDTLREVSQTLHAALADPDIAEQVRAGRMVTAVSYSGFGPAGFAVDTGKPATTTTLQPASKKKRDREYLKTAARAELDEATAAVREARGAAETARTAADRARTQAAEIAARIEELRDELERAEHQRHFARSAEKAAAEKAARFDRDLARAERWAAKVQRALDELSD